MNDSGRLEFDFEPGTKYQYSGEGMEYLRRALENKFGKDLGELTDSLVFKPLDMQDATLKWISPLDTLRFAKWYDGEGKLHDVDYRTPQPSAADDLLITLKELAIFGISAMNPEFLGGDLYEEMIRPQVDIHDNAGQGLGWTIVNNLPNEHYVLNHDGGDIGVATTIILLPKSKSGIIVLTNGDNGRIICNEVVKKSITFGPDIIKKLYWGGQIPKIITIDKDLLHKYEGTYLTNQKTELSFLAKEKTLKIRGEGVPGVEIYPSSNNKFFPTDFEVFFKFIEIDSGMKFELINQDKVVLEGIKRE